MTLLSGDTGRISVGPLKEFVITQPNPFVNSTKVNPADSTFIADLPTAQSATTGLTVTLDPSWFPTISPAVPMIYCAMIMVSGYYSGASASAPVYSQPFRVNADTTKTSLQASYNSSAGTTNRGWAHNIHRFYDVKPGDTFQVQLWASSAGFSFDYYLVWVFPTRPQVFSKPGGLVKDLKYTGLTGFTVDPTYNPTGFTASIVNTQSTSIAIGDSYAPNNSKNAYSTANGNQSNLIISGRNEFPFFIALPSDWGGFKSPSSDLAAGTTGYAHSSLRYLQVPSFPRGISFREISL